MPFKEEEKKREYQRKYYHKNKEKYKENRNKRRNEKREYLQQYKEERGCKNCGEKRHYVLVFHHIAEKTAQPAKMIDDNFSYERINAELEKCIVLCANCHSEVHYKERNGK